MNEEEFADYANRVQALDDFSKSPYWDVFTDWVLAEQARRAKEVLSGRLDHERYLKQCGFVEACDFILRGPEIQKSRFAGVQMQYEEAQAARQLAEAQAQA